MAPPKRLSLALLGTSFALAALAPAGSVSARPTRSTGSTSPAALTTPVGPRPSTSTAGGNAGVLAAPTVSTLRSVTPPRSSNNFGSTDL